MSESEQGTEPIVVLIDGANAAAGGGFRPPTLARVLGAKAAAAAKWPTATIIVVVDANLRYKLPESDRRQLDTLCRDGEVLSTPSFTIGQADAVLLALAAVQNAKIVSNDGFNEHLADAPLLLDEGRVFGLVALDDAPTLIMPRRLRRQRAAR